jgi:DNA-binding phage protein
MNIKDKKLKQELEDLNIDPQDCRISDEDFDTTFAKILSKNPKELKSYKKRIIKRFNETGNLDTFLDNLKVVAKAEGISKIANKSHMHRPNIYRILSKENDPRARNLFSVIKNMGIEFKAVATKV